MDSDLFTTILSPIEIIKLKSFPNKKLDQWREKKYHSQNICEKLLQNCPDQIDRIPTDNLSYEEFAEKYEINYQPLIIQGLDKECFGEKWKLEKIVEKYKNKRFKIAEDDDGTRFKIDIKTYFDYFLNQIDDDPLYMFAPIFKDKEEKLDLNSTANHTEKKDNSQKKFSSNRDKISNCLFDTSEIFKEEAHLKTKNLIDWKETNDFQIPSESFKIQPEKLKKIQRDEMHNNEETPKKLEEKNLNEKNYSVPKYFQDDIMALIKDKSKPAYKWILLGPKRSGSGIHIDPFKTSAWNILFSGKKRWIMIKEHVHKSIVTSKTPLPPLEYFSTFLPSLLPSLPSSSYLEFIQYPGDTVFVPGGWWHAVINLENSFAFTQNFLSGNNFDKGWEGLREERRRLAEKLYLKMKVEKRQFYEKAKLLNEKSGIAFPEEENKMIQKIASSYEINKILSCEEVLWSELEEIEKERKVSSDDEENSVFSD